MPSPDSWLQIPTSVLDLGQRTADADAWAQQQRAKIAETWANTQRQAVSTMATTWQKGMDSVDHFADGFGSATDPQQPPQQPLGYNDMAGADTSPQGPLSASQGQPEGIQAPGTPGTQLLPGSTPIEDAVKNASTAARGELVRESQGPSVGNLAVKGLLTGTDAFGQGIQSNAEQNQYAFNPTLGTRADQPARSQASPRTDKALSGFTPEQLATQQDLGFNAVLGTLPTSTNPETQKLLTMYTADVPKVVTPLAERIQAAGNEFVRAMTDRGAPLAQFQEIAQKYVGRPLRMNEMAAELSRLNPDKAVEVHIQQGLQPAIQSVPEADLPFLSTYLTAQHNVDVAKAIGQKVETAGLTTPLKLTEGEKRAASIKAQIAMYERFRAAGVAAGDGTIVTHYDGLLNDAKAKLATATRLALKQVTKADAARAAKAGAAGQAAEDSRAFSGGLNAASSADILRTLPAELGPRFTPIQDAAQKVWDFSNSLRQRAVQSGLWTPETAQDLRQEYPHYVPTKILAYMEDPTRIANGASLSVRDQGLKRLTIEGTELAREDPLASLARSAYQMEALAKKNDAFNAFVRLNNLLPEEQRIIKPVEDSYTATRDEVKVSGFINGKRATYVMPKEFETVVKQEPNAPIKGLAPAMALYRSLITSLSPAFVAGQVPLDAMSYIIRESTRGGGPQALPKVLTELFHAYGDAFQGIAQRTYQGTDTARFLAGGGGMGGHFGGRPGDAAATIADLARKNAFTVNSADDVRRIVKDILTLKPVEAVGERAELAPRVASMRLAEKRGQNAVQAVINGRTVTMDFQQGGTVAKFINQFIPFFNVGMQGLATPARVIRENPKAALGTFLAYLAAPTVSAEAWNNADPQRAKDYADVPQYIKDRSVVVMLPAPASVDTQGERHPQYVEIRTREFSPFVDLTREVMRRAMGNDSRSWADLASGAINASSPIQTDSALGLFGSLVPPGISTGVDLSNNRDSYRGSMIATKGNDERASALSQLGANAIYGATGINARPSQVEFATGDLAGGAGQIVRDVSNVVTGKPSSGTPQSTPLLGQVTRRFVGGSIGQRLQSAQDQRMTGDTEKVLREAGIYDITPVQDTINGLPLSRDEHAMYQQVTNRLLNRVVTRAGQSPAFQKLGQADKADLLRTLMDDMRTMAGDITLGQVDPTALKERMKRQYVADAQVRVGAGK